MPAQLRSSTKVLSTCTSAPLGMAKLSAQDGKVLWLCEELDYPLCTAAWLPVLHDDKLFVVLRWQPKSYVQPWTQQR